MLSHTLATIHAWQVTHCRCTSAFRLTDAQCIQEFVSMPASLRNDLDAEARDAEVLWLQMIFAHYTGRPSHNMLTAVQL